MSKPTVYFDPALGNALQRFSAAFEAKKAREAAKTAQETARRLGEREREGAEDEFGSEYPEKAGVRSYGP